MSMNKGKYIWMDGKFVLWEKAQIHVLTHGLHYGGSVYEGMRTYPVEVAGKAGRRKRAVAGIYRLDDHMERFVRSQKEIAMKPPYSKTQLKRVCVELLKKNKVVDGYIRPIAFYGYDRLGIFWGDVPVKVAIAAFPWGAYLPNEMKLKISPFQRLSNKAVKIEAKVGSYYVNSNYATEHAKNVSPKADEALLLDENGYIAEASCANIFFVKGTTLYTPARGAILPGLTRDSVIELAEFFGLKVVEKKIKPSEIGKFDECFTTGTATEVTSVVKIDGKKIGDGKMGDVTTVLRDGFDDLIHGRLTKFKKWITFVD
ncbi:branched-chain amino acid transaminase [Candidatus Peregrinibacteria bacterium]|jgi:branched-chain amino acid aminotransferase|nr:branched-chain amino acid transaminase [Candidatus Peregrinibacteria bacterium]MBT4056305.1 branched-chain amino acid transaminase [Candidatus Peregrinibacteria bacterium]